MRRWDLGGVFGGGFEMRFQQHSLAVEFRETHGWRNISYSAIPVMRNIVVTDVGVEYSYRWNRQ